MQCFNCNGWGHRASNCPSDRPINSVEDIANDKQVNVVSKIAYATRAGQDINGYHKINSNECLVESAVCKDTSLNLFALLDGHGPNGQQITRFMKKCLLNSVRTQI